MNREQAFERADHAISQVEKETNHGFAGWFRKVFITSIIAVLEAYRLIELRDEAQEEIVSEIFKRLQGIHVHVNLRKGGEPLESVGMLTEEGVRDVLAFFQDHLMIEFVRKPRL